MKNIRVSDAKFAVILWCVRRSVPAGTDEKDIRLQKQVLRELEKIEGGE